MREHHPRVMSASTLIGDEVYNDQGEHLGEIKEFMIDTTTGEIAYAVLSFGGFLGMGDKLFAIPWEALRIDMDRRRILLNVDKEILKDAPGFDKNDWPSSPDRSFIDRVYRHYGYEPYYSRRTMVGETGTGTTGTMGNPTRPGPEF
jgi:sporulation protein YlmC with PRC-barrel domain